MANSPCTFCDQHKKESLLFYCLEDKSLICQQCLLGKHLNHKIEESKAYLIGKQALSHLSQAMEMMDSYEKEIKQEIEAFTKTEETAKYQIDTKHSEVQK